MDNSFVRRGGVDAAAGVRSAWLPDRWALGLTGMVSLSSGLDAALWSVLPLAQNVGFGIGAPGAVVLVRAASVLAGANRALRTLLTNVAACAACAAYVMANLRTAELVTDTTFSSLNAFLFHGAIAAVLLGFDGDELKGLRPEPRNVRERFRARPALLFLFWPAVGAAFLPVIGISFGVDYGAPIGWGILAAGAVLFYVRDVAAGGNGHWP